MVALALASSVVVAARTTLVLEVVALPVEMSSSPPLTLMAVKPGSVEPELVSVQVPEPDLFRVGKLATLLTLSEPEPVPLTRLSTLAPVPPSSLPLPEPPSVAPAWMVTVSTPEPPR